MKGKFFEMMPPCLAPNLLVRWSVDDDGKIFARKKTPPQGRTQVHKNKKKPSRVDLKRELRDNTDYGNE